jgi:hypothetical protein
MLPGTFNGAEVSKKLYLPSSLHFSESAFRSHNSPIDMPNRARKYWWRGRSAAVPSLPSGLRGGRHSKAIISPATAATSHGASDQAVNVILQGSVRLTVFVPEPLGRSLVSMDATGTVSTHQLDLLFGTDAREPFGEPRSDNDHIAMLELNALLLRDLFDIIGCKRVGVVRVELDTFLVCISLPIDEYSSRDEAATLVPVVQSGQLLIVVFVAVLLLQLFNVGLNTVVAFGTFLVVEVAQTVPLAGALSVELDFIIIPVSPFRPKPGVLMAPIGQLSETETPSLSSEYADLITSGVRRLRVP